MDEITYEESIINDIDALSQIEMARLVRFAPVGHIYFDTTKPYSKIFNKRFKELGGMTPAISKELGSRMNNG